MTYVKLQRMVINPQYAMSSLSEFGEINTYLLSVTHERSFEVRKIENAKCCFAAVIQTYLTLIVIQWNLSMWTPPYIGHLSYVDTATCSSISVSSDSG